MTASLLVAGHEIAAADPAPPPAAPTASATAFPRPDDPDAPLRAAIEEARKIGEPVAVEAAFTESSRTWAYPDGHLTLQSYAGPSQLKQADGTWAWIDTTLVEKDGVLRPKLAKADLSFSLGGDRPFAIMERDRGQRFALSWTKDLPRPEVKGNVARYADAAGAGADLVVTALPTGFRHDVVLRERPTAPVELRIPVETEGLTLSEGKRGKGLKLTDAKGRQVASAAEPVAVDAGPSAAEAAGRQAAGARTGKIDTSVVTENGRQTLVLKPDQAFLSDPRTRYPLTVDPTTTLALLSDVVVSNHGPVDTSPASTTLQTSVERTYADGHITNANALLKFDTAVLSGRSVGSAKLEMYAEKDVACRWYGPGGVEAKRVTSAWNASDVSWSTKPSVTSFGSSIQICPSTPSTDDNGNWIPRTITWDVTAMANAWASGALSEGIQVAAYTDFDHQPPQGTGFWIYYHSAERVGGKPPKLTVSYWLPPEIPTVTAESIDSMTGNDAIARSQSVKVGFKSSVPEAKNLDYTVTVNDSTMAPPPAFPTGHVAHWKFDEAGGAGTAADSSGNGHNAAYTGSRRKAVTGKLGSAIELNDMTGSNGCCLPDSHAATSRAVLNQNASFSMSTWVKLNDSDSIQYVASQDGDPFGLSVYYLGSSWQKWRLQISGSGGTTGYGVWVDSAKLVKADTWTHLVAQYDAAAAKIRLYVDGVLSGEADFQPTDSVTSGPFRIGARKGSADIHNLQGAVDDMRLYQRALTLKEIKDLYGEVAATSYNAKPSGQVIEQTFQLHNPASLKFVVKACRSGVSPPSCNTSPAYRLTSDAPVLPADAETGMTDPAQPILSGMVNRPSGGPVSAKYYLYDNSGAPVGTVPLGVRTVNGGERASFQIPVGTVQLGTTYKWQMVACVGPSGSDPGPQPTPTPTPSPTPTPTPTPTPAALKAHWPLDETAGIVAADASGNNRPATVTAGTWSAGKTGGALTVGTRASGYAVAAGPVVATNDSYTVSAWARIDNVTADHALISQDGAVNSAFKLAYSPGDKKWRLVTYQSDTANAAPVRVLSTQDAVAGQWTHLTGVYDAAAGKLRLYVNGVLNAETAYTSTWTAGGDVQLGRTKVNSAHANYLKGSLDEVRLHQKALTQQEITALVSGTPAAAPQIATAQAAEGPEVCTSKTAPVSFTTPGTPPPDPVEDVRKVTLGKDSLVIKKAITDPTACDGAPCVVTDDTVVRTGGTGAEKTAAVVGLRLDELPDGAVISEAVLKLGTPVCPAGTCPADAVITATPLKSPVTNETKGSDLAGDADPEGTPYSLPLAGPQADIAGSEHQWLLLTSNKDEIITFAEPGAAEQPSLAITYQPAGPPSKVLNLSASGGDASATASWGLPESTGGLALLDGYDVEVVDGGGSTVKTVEVKEPWVAVSSLANGASYTIRVRAKTAFGTGEWEAATATTKAVPPPVVATPGTPCVPFLDTPPSAAKAVAADSGVDAYVDRIKAYYKAQDAVLEGRAATVWDAPGVAATTSSTAKLSLLNTSLAQEREAMSVDGRTRSASTVQLTNPVVQAMQNGSVRVTAEVKRSWTETSPDPDPSMAAPAGTVEPSEATISIFVFDRCGNVTIIDAPIEANEDSTDHADHTNAGGSTAPPPCGGPKQPACKTETEKRTSCWTSVNSLYCEMRQQLGRKKWYLLTSGYSEWPKHTGIGQGCPLECDEFPEHRWKIDKYQSFMHIYSANGSKDFDTPFGRAFTKALYSNQRKKGGMEFRSKGCFRKQTIDGQIKGTISLMWEQAGISGEKTVSGKIAEGCTNIMLLKNENPNARTKISDATGQVQARCEVPVFGECGIQRYFHHFNGRMWAYFSVTTKSNGKTVVKPYSVKADHSADCYVSRVRTSPTEVVSQPLKCEPMIQDLVSGTLD
ncbi:LamG-like jellyroll fold domain-containing protein [Nonomuraea endophytica]|uniref:LamG-like jellyroll fold domain-containing protein n=1 Tax=Nonomuraea endophytica TaxID=714136 RepID=UPI0037CBA113